MQSFVRQFGGPSFSMKQFKGKGSWKLGTYSIVSKNKRRRDCPNSSYTFQKMFDDNKELIGCRKLLGGGTFEQCHIQSMQVLAKAARNDELIFDMKMSRHSTVATHVYAQLILADFIAGGRTTKRQKSKGEKRTISALEQCFQNAESGILEKEVHFAANTIETSYCDMLKDFELCKPATALQLCMLNDEKTYTMKKIIWCHPIMKAANGDYRNNVIDIGGSGILVWPTTLAPCYATSGHNDMTVSERCHDFQLLEPHEQIQCLWTLSAIRTFLAILHEHYHSFANKPEYAKLWKFVKEITTPPIRPQRHGSPRKSKK